MTRRRLTVMEAAGELGISQDAVRMRIKRGTLDATKDGRQVFVLLDTDQTTDQTPPDSTALISRLEDEVRFLREELARKDAILLRMAESIPQLEAPSEAPGGPERAADVVGREEPFTDEQTPTSRPWWRFWG